MALCSMGTLTCCTCVAVRVNETDTFADEDGANDEYFDFEDVRPAPLGPPCPRRVHRDCCDLLFVLKFLKTPRASLLVLQYAAVCVSELVYINVTW